MAKDNSLISSGLLERMKMKLQINIQRIMQKMIRHKLLKRSNICGEFY